MHEAIQWWDPVSKFQELLDFSEGQVATRAPQQPSDAVLERQKQFGQQEARMLELRKTRLAAANVPAEPGQRTYDVVRHNGAWRILYLGRHSGAFADQQAA